MAPGCHAASRVPAIRQGPTRVGAGATVNNRLGKLPDPWTRRTRAHRSLENYRTVFHELPQPFSSSLEGDISIELRTGTFLFRFDTAPMNQLTYSLYGRKVCGAVHTSTVNWSTSEDVLRGERLRTQAWPL